MAALFACNSHREYRRSTHFTSAREVDDTSGLTLIFRLAHASHLDFRARRPSKGPTLDLICALCSDCLDNGKKEFSSRACQVQTSAFFECGNERAHLRRRFVLTLPGEAQPTRLCTRAFLDWEILERSPYSPYLPNADLPPTNRQLEKTKLSSFCRTRVMLRHGRLLYSGVFCRLASKWK